MEQELGKTDCSYYRINGNTDSNRIVAEIQI